MASWLGFVILLAGLTTYCFLRPTVALDSFAYYSLLDTNHRQLFDESPRVCSSSVPGPNVSCAETDFFKSIAALDGASFNRFLSFYQVKPGYVWCAMLLHRELHVPGFVALRLVSSLSFGLLILAMALWLGEHYSPPIACALAICAGATQPVLALGKALLPEAFSNAALLFAAYAIIYRTSTLRPRLILLALLPLARIDNIVFCLVFGSVLIYRATARGKLQWIRLSAFVLGCVCYNSLLQHMTHGPSYRTLYDYTFLGWTLDSPVPRFVLSPYIHAEIRSIAIIMLLHLPWALLFTIFALSTQRLWRPAKDLLFASAATCAFRLLLFPSQEQRFYTWFLLIAFLAAAISFSQASKGNNETLAVRTTGVD